MNFNVGFLFICGFGLIASDANAVPSTINAPVSGTGWTYNGKAINANGSDVHGGINAGIGANDNKAFDINYGSGWDDEGLPIYAVESGCIYSENGWGGYSSGQLLINHTTGSDNWSTGYLHMKNIVKKTGCVSKGDKIGELSNVSNIASFSPHLHFAVYNSHGKSGLQSVNVKINEVSYPLTSASPLSTTPIFDGTGSLVDSAGSCEEYGCTHDDVKLHPHDNQLSSGFFQVLWTQGKCEAVELDGLTYADVEVRSWDGYGTDSEYYKLSALPAVVPLKSNKWNLIAVKTTAAIQKGSTRTVSASCVANSYNDARVSKVEGTPMMFDLDYGWGGNGSIISHSKNEDFGRSMDWVVLLRDKNTLAAFQVTRSSTCQTVRFKTPVSFNLSWKTWDAESWQGSKAINNGDTFTLPINGDWWILKVKAPATGKNDSYVEAICE